MAVIRASIRPIRREDMGPILELARQLDDWFNAPGLAQMGKDLESHEGVAAWADGRLVGFVTWNPIDRETANLSWMGVAADRQRRGIGRVLVAAMLDRLREAGFRTVEVSTVADSVDYPPYDGTRAFYRAMGFADFRVDEGFYGEDPDRYDRLVLRRPVVSTAREDVG